MEALDRHAELLRAAGVSADALTSAERQALEERGFVVLRGVVGAAQLERMRAAFEAACARALPGSGGAYARGTRHIDVLPADERAFDPVYSEPRVLAAIDHVLRRPFGLLVAGGRDPLAGHGLQGLHQDWPRRASDEPWRVATALWMLDAFTEASGATRVVPGSHHVPRPPPKSMQAPEHRHRDEERALGQAGSVLVLNGHLWHAGARNESGASRRALQCQFVDRAVLPPGQAKPVPAHLGAAVRALYGA
jgi:ectoine hydroxylase-related dioxygenase (phytanoyl-CoA dioxygenase family)